MLRATQSSEIPAAELARVKADDSDRTRMLKAVMKSVSEHASSGLGGIKDEEEQAAKQLIMQKAQEDEDYILRAVQERARDPCDWGYLSSEQERRINATVMDDDVMLAVGTDFTEVLKKSGTHVKSLSSSLSSRQPLPERHHIDSSPADDIHLVRRDEVEECEGTEHQRREQAARAFVQEHVKFNNLDKLEQQINETEKYEDLRKQFVQHHKYHHVLVDLSDHALVDRGIWRAAVHEAKFPTQVRVAEAAPKVQQSLFTPKALNRSAKAMGSRQTLAPGAKASRISFFAAGGGGTSPGSSPLSRSGKTITLC